MMSCEQTAFAYGMSALIPVLALVAAVKATEDGVEYSLGNTVQQALFLPTSRDAKYKAKAESIRSSFAPATYCLPPS